MSPQNLFRTQVLWDPRFLPDTEKVNFRPQANFQDWKMSANSRISYIISRLELNSRCWLKTCAIQKELIMPPTIIWQDLWTKTNQKSNKTESKCLIIELVEMESCNLWIIRAWLNLLFCVQLIGHIGILWNVLHHMFCLNKPLVINLFFF